MPDPTGPVRAAVEAIDDLIGVLARAGYTVVGPTVRHGAIVLEEVSGLADLPVGWGDDQAAGRYRLVRRDDGALFGYVVGPQSPRRYLSPPRRTLWSATVEDGRFHVVEADPEPARYAFLGLRGCELAAIAVQDGVLRDGPYPDPAYVDARERAFVVAVNCGEPAATCFCASMGTGPAAGSGYDLALTEVRDRGDHWLLVDVGTDRGAAVLAGVANRPATGEEVAAARAVVDRSAARMSRSLDPDAARDVLAANLEHPRWDDVAARCLSCTNCTLVCPTCFCTAIDDATSLSGDRAERVERWASCFSLDHSWLHGTGPVRSDTRARYRQWLTHKLSTWWDQFGESGCVGCGRCITWCPARIDLTEEVAAIATGAGGPVG